jgi:hypothetical protein
MKYSAVDANNTRREKKSRLEKETHAWAPPLKEKLICRLKLLSSPRRERNNQPLK